MLTLTILVWSATALAVWGASRSLLPALRYFTVGESTGADLRAAVHKVATDADAAIRGRGEALASHHFFVSHVRLSEKMFEYAEFEKVPSLYRQQSEDFTAFRLALLHNLLADPPPSERLRNATARIFNCDMPHLFTDTSRVLFSFQVPEDHDVRVWSHAYLTTNFDTLLESACQMAITESKPLLWRFPIGLEGHMNKHLLIAFCSYGADRLADLRKKSETGLGAEGPSQDLSPSDAPPSISEH